MSKMRMWIKDYVPLVISFIALVVSSINFYMTQLEAPSLTVTAADALWARYVGDKTSGNIEIHTTLVFRNLGPRPGVVRKVVLDISQHGANSSVLLEAAFFERLGVDLRFSPELIAGPVAVSGKSTVDRQINFITPRGDPAVRPFPAAARYDVTVFFWDEEAGTPKIGETFSVEITDADVDYWSAQRNGEEGGKAIKIANAAWRSWQAGNRPRSPQ